MRFEGKTIVVGVCASAAIYKSLDWIKRLREQGARVHVVLTSHAAELIRPQLFEAISGQPVSVRLFQGSEEAGGMPHIEMARVDAVTIVPATASLIGRYAWGLATDLLSTLLLATKAPVVVAPAMNTLMWEHPLVQDNVARLRSSGVFWVDPRSGLLACGEEGVGRLADLESIEWTLERALTPQDWKGRRVLVSMGTTQEALDPVRFLSNRSSGRMGLALARAAWARGAIVTVVRGPCEATFPTVSDLTVFDVVSMVEMRQALTRFFPEQDLFFAAAAVSDFSPSFSSDQKLKRSRAKGGLFPLELKPNPDILAELGALKRSDQRVVGFCLETDRLEASVADKFLNKSIDLMVGNDPTVLGADEGHFFIYEGPTRTSRSLSLTKHALGHHLLDRLSGLS